jgi:hypothetical protein
MSSSLTSFKVHILVFIFILFVVMSTFLNFHRLWCIDIVLINEGIHLTHERGHIDVCRIESNLKKLILTFHFTYLVLQGFDLVF